MTMLLECAVETAVIVLALRPIAPDIEEDLQVGEFFWRQEGDDIVAQLALSSPLPETYPSHGLTGRSRGHPGGGARLGAPWPKAPALQPPSGR